MHQSTLPAKTSNGNLEDHPIASIFPLLPETELCALADDIKKRGVEIPIVLYEGKILDGRNRYRAAIRAGAHFATNYYTGDKPVEHVLSLNLHRRHLSPSQAAAVAVEALPHFEAEARKRQGQRTDISANLRGSSTNGKASEHAAATVNVSPRLVEQAKAIKLENPALYEEIRRGEITVHAASKPHVVNNSGAVEWYTPPDFLQLAREVMGDIDLDPASCEVANKNVKAKKFFTAKDDGLKQAWKGRVWLNPPYESGIVDKFVMKLLAELELGVTEAMVLTNNATETAWGTALLGSAAAVCFPKGRIKFHTANGVMNTPLQGQMICYFGKNIQLFKRIHERIGPVKL